MDLVKCLLKHKETDINKESDYGINPLLVACFFKNKNLVDYLLDHDANVDIRDNKDNLPLHIACYLKSKEIVKSLVSKNNKLSTVLNEDGSSPIDIATELQNKKILKILNRKKNRKKSNDKNKYSNR
jgi:ankyrin repeat protein